MLYVLIGTFLCCSNFYFISMLARRHCTILLYILEETIFINVKNVLKHADLLPAITSTSVSGTSVSLTLSQPSGSLSVDMYSVVFTSTACPNIESRSASTTTNSLTVDNLEAGALYSYTLTGANNVAELTRTTTSTITTMEAGISLSWNMIMYNKICNSYFHKN